MPDDHASSREPSPIGIGEQEAAVRRVRVLLPLPLPEALDYLVPELSPPEPGSFVRVPLGQREVTGIIWDGVGDELPEERLKDSRSSACERTRQAASPKSAGSPWISVHNRVSRLGPSSRSTVPAANR